MASSRIIAPISKIYLDPNNYRFIDRADYKTVPNSMLLDERIQLRTLNFVLGKNNENVKDLIVSFKNNGFLDIDQIQVMPAGDGFMVTEGNRRVATLKYLYDEYKSGNDIGQVEPSIFENVNIVVENDNDPIKYLIGMGLHHISGKKRWSAVNEAQLINDLIEKYGMNEEDVCNSLSISKYSLRRSRRTLFLINQYKQSDFGDQFKPDMFSIFQAIISSQDMKEWLDWDDFVYRARNTTRLDRLFSWLSEVEEVDNDADDKELISKREPIITQYRQINQLAGFIFDEKALEKMEEGRSLVDGYSYSGLIGEEKLRNAITNMKGDVQTAFNFSEHLSQSDYDEIEKLKDKLDRLLPSSQSSITINHRKLTNVFEIPHFHFRNVSISSYRKLENLRVKNLSKVNIFVGANNAGKTSVLEAIYLLSQLNDPNALLDLEKSRGKFYGDLPSKWIDRSFQYIFQADGWFDESFIQLSISKEDTEEDIAKTSYISTIVERASVSNPDTNLESSVHLFSNREPEVRFKKIQNLCSAAFTSPYRYNGSLLQRAHAVAVQEKFYEEIIGFLRDHLDSSIENIELVNYDGQARFLVSSTGSDTTLDITKYGEGLQRIFEIALLMGYCRNGLLSIDEFDSGLHKSLLLVFTKFVQQLAGRFNVQVCLSTHSKECIDAFIENEYANDQLTAYVMQVEDGKIVCKYIDGSRLERLIENINLDIR